MGSVNTLVIQPRRHWKRQHPRDAVVVARGIHCSYWRGSERDMRNRNGRGVIRFGATRLFAARWQLSSLLAGATSHRRIWGESFPTDTDGMLSAATPRWASTAGPATEYRVCVGDENGSKSMEWEIA